MLPFVLVALYLVLVAVLAGGLVLARRPPRRGPATLPRVSIVVAARNEERALPRCLAALEALSYPRDRLEFLFVDDGSTDATAHLLADAARRLPNARVLSTAGVSTHLRAKARPLSIGAAAATGEWIFIADADAAVPPAWIESLLAWAAPDVGLLGGPFVAEGRGLAAALERGAQAYVMAVPFGVAALGGAPIASGPNMAIRRDAYVQGGGLEAVPHAVAEDMALLRLCQAAGLRCAGGADPQTTARVAPVGTIVGLLHQQKRWILGGISDAPAFIKLLVLIVGAYAWTGSVICLFWWAVDVQTWLLAASLRALGDQLLALALARKTGVRGLLPWVPAVELYLWIGFLILIPWCIVAPKPRWMGAGFEERLA